MYGARKILKVAETYSYQVIKFQTLPEIPGKGRWNIYNKGGTVLGAFYKRKLFSRKVVWIADTEIPDNILEAVYYNSEKFETRDGKEFWRHEDPNTNQKPVHHEEKMRDLQRSSKGIALRH